jgi:hypothetical protein
MFSRSGVGGRSSGRARAHLVHAGPDRVGPALEPQGIASDRRPWVTGRTSHRSTGRGPSGCRLRTTARTGPCDRRRAAQQEWPYQVNSASRECHRVEPPRRPGAAKCISSGDDRARPRLRRRIAATLRGSLTERLSRAPDQMPAHGRLPPGRTRSTRAAHALGQRAGLHRRPGVRRHRVRRLRPGRRQIVGACPRAVRQKGAGAPPRRAPISRHAKLTRALVVASFAASSFRPGLRRPGPSPANGPNQ